MIPFLNDAGRQALAVASSMLWQTAVLVLVLLLVEFLAGRRMRASLRCGLWLLVILKLLLPPSLKSPVSPGYWIGRWIIPPLTVSVASTARVFAEANLPVPLSAPLRRGEVTSTSAIRPNTRPAAKAPRLTTEGSLAAFWALGSLAIAVGILRRHQQMRRLIKTSRPATAELLEALRGAAAELGLQRVPELRLTRADHSPAVSGLLRPVIVLPAGLASRLTPAALRDVLLHELIHVRRRDLWLNLPQVLVQVVWWWNPFVWLANARIRLLREQAVDEHVLLLNRGAEEPSYPATLVAVARYCADRPMLTLSFVGILESRHRLRARLDRLLNGPLPTRAGLGRQGWFALVLTACLALPMASARRVDASSPGVGLSSHRYQFDPDRLMTALESRVSYTVEDFSVEDLPANHGGDYPGGPGSFIIGGRSKQRNMEARTRALLGKYFAKAGVTFPAPDPRALDTLQKTFSWVAGNGLLVIRASEAELKTIDQAIRDLHLEPEEMPSTGPGQALMSPRTIEALESSPSATPDPLRWLPWSQEKVRAARQQGQTVLVDFTAKWCLSCKVNRATVLNSPQVRQRLTTGDILLLTADYTHENPEIAGELRAFNRPGVPAVVIYPADPQSAPVLLPEQLSVKDVLDALPEPSKPGAPTSTLRQVGDPDSQPRETPEIQVLHIQVHSSEPHYLIQDEALTVDQLKERIRTEIQAHPDTLVTIHSADSTEKLILNAIEACRHAGATRFNVQASVPRPDDQSHPDPNISGHVSPATANSPSAPMDPELMKRYGLVPGPSTDPSETPMLIYKMDPNLARRYGLAPENPENPEDGAAAVAKYKLDPVLARRYGLISENPASPGDSAAAILKSSPGPTKIESRLERWVLDTFEFDNTSITEVVESFAKALRGADPDHRGVNLLLVPSIDVGSTAETPNGAGPATERDTLGKVRVRITPALRNVRAKDALDAIIRGAEPPLEYTIEDYGVVIRPRRIRELPLETRVFKVDPHTFIQGVDSVTSGATAQQGLVRSPEELQSKLAEFFKATGVSPAVVSRPAVDQESGGGFTYDPNSGRLTVRATPDDLSIIQSALNSFTVPPPAAQIRLRVVRMNPSSGATLSLDSMEIDTREGVLSGTTSERDPAVLLGGAPPPPRGRQIADLTRSAASGRRIALSFAEAQLATDSPGTENDANDPPVMEVLPIVRSDASTFDISVVVRRSPGDPAPIQRRATLKAGDSFIIVFGSLTPDSGAKPLLFSVTPTVEDPAGRK